MTEVVPGTLSLCERLGRGILIRGGGTFFIYPPGAPKDCGRLLEEFARLVVSPAEADFISYLL